MTMAINAHRCDVMPFAAAIARSPILMGAGARRGAARLPDGFDEIDAAILAWIASESRRVAPAFTLM